MRKGGGRGGGDNPHVETTMHLNWEGRIHWGGERGERRLSFGALLISERENAPAHIRLTLSNTVHEVDAAGGNDHLPGHLPEVCGGHPRYWTPARSKALPWSISTTSKVFDIKRQVKI